jgi:hypothetical protein
MIIMIIIIMIIIIIKTARIARKIIITPMLASRITKKENVSQKEVKKENRDEIRLCTAIYDPSVIIFQANILVVIYDNNDVKLRSMINDATYAILRTWFLRSRKFQGLVATLTLTLNPKP